MPLGSCVPWHVARGRAQRRCFCDTEPVSEQPVGLVMLLPMNVKGLSINRKGDSAFFVFLSLHPLAVQNLVALTETGFERQSLGARSLSWPLSSRQFELPTGRML